MILCQAYFSTRCSKMAMRDDVERWQTRKGMGLRLGDKESDFFNKPALCRRRTPVLYIAGAAPKMMCEFKKNTENVGQKIHPDKTKILSNQSTSKRKEVEISNIKVEILQQRSHSAPRAAFASNGNRNRNNSSQRTPQQPQSSCSRSALRCRKPRF